NSFTHKLVWRAGGVGNNMKHILTTTIYDLAFGAKGIGKIDGKICFVEGALPGEEVEFEVIKDTSRYMEGKVTKIITASKDRILPVCPYYVECGGCSLQHVSYERELFYKQEQVVQLIRRIAGCKDFLCEKIEKSDKYYNYRSSVTVHSKGSGFGYFASKSHSIIKIKECVVADKAINEILPELEKSVEKKNVTLKVDHNAGVWSSSVLGEKFFIDRYCGMDVYLSTKAFSQANRYIAERIAEVLETWIGSDTEDAVFFDLCCGTGFFSFLLKQKFLLKVGVDSNRVAIECAKRTLKMSDEKNIKFYKGSVENVFWELYEKNKSRSNVLFIDPPRAGVNNTLLKKIAGLEELNAIYYLSCDVACLARDIKVLIADGKWRLAKALPFDMFPRTGHIEVLAEIVRV
ncbi:MAG: TRAM domain-containing protein, partial [Candidatus Omnitrophica bacterium]|nr:TRAM domain-containing protein [Candidatus Omnitrophota bacterium]